LLPVLFVVNAMLRTALRVFLTGGLNHLCYAWHDMNCRQQLAAQLGGIEDSALPDLLQHARTLARYQQQRSPAQSSGSNSSAGAGNAAPAGQTRSTFQQQSQPAQEFGADLEFHQPRVYASSDEAVLAMCGSGSGTAEPGQPR
jgi:hypothetical protein